MFRFVAGRLLQMIPVLLVIATLTFFMIRLAGFHPHPARKGTSEARVRFLGLGEKLEDVELVDGRDFIAKML